jgi:hypothetical protein
MAYRSSSCSCARLALCLLVPAAGLLAQSGPDPSGSRHRATGAPVAPVFEGWKPNRNRIQFRDDDESTIGNR